MTDARDLTPLERRVLDCLGAATRCLDVLELVELAGVDQPGVRSALLVLRRRRLVEARTWAPAAGYGYAVTPLGAREFQRGYQLRLDTAPQPRHSAAASSNAGTR